MTGLTFIIFIVAVGGNDGSDFPSADNRGRCSTGTCRIWDWSLHRDYDSEIELSPALSIPDGDNTARQLWTRNSGACNSSNYPGAIWKTSSIDANPPYADGAGTRVVA